MPAKLPPLLVVFDMAGTTVHDRSDVARCLADALRKAGFRCDEALANTRMGMAKPLAIAELAAVSLERGVGRVVTPGLVGEIHRDFLNAINEHYRTHPSVRAVEGAEEIFAALRHRGVKVALDTGFSRPTVEVILARLGWSVPATLDAVVTSDEVARGRPAPDLLREAMRRCGVSESARCAHVGDTPSDVGEGLAAGAGWNIAIAGPSHSAEQLAACRPTHVVGALTAVPAALGLDFAA
jgi:phosphonatase-like hydrolase